MGKAWIKGGSVNTKEKIACCLCGALECDFCPIEEAEECSKYLPTASKLLTFIKEAGYVKLDADQSLPRNPNLGIPAYYQEYKEAQQDMFKQGWRKVEL